MNSLVDILLGGPVDGLRIALTGMSLNVLVAIVPIVLARACLGRVNELGGKLRDGRFMAASMQSGLDALRDFQQKSD